MDVVLDLVWEERGETRAAPNVQFSSPACAHGAKCKPVIKQPIRSIVGDDLSCAWIKLGKSLGSAEPEVAVAITDNPQDDVTGQAVRFGVPDELLRGHVESVEASPVAANPEHAAPIFMDGSDVVVAQAVGIIRVVQILPKRPHRRPDMVEAVPGPILRSPM